MAFQFTRHYTIEEARLLLPQVRKWLDQVQHYHDRITKLEKRFQPLVNDGADLGGNSINEFVRICADLQDVLEEFQSREIQIKDVERGLVDFPALRDGREIFLCWEKSEDDIEHWHDLDTGYSGREPL